MGINVNQIASNLKANGIEYFHKDFIPFANTFLQHSSNRPILLKGPRMCGKKTMVNQLGNLLECKPKKYDFDKFTIDGVIYQCHDELIEELTNSYKNGEFVVIENLEELGPYDNIILSSLVKEFYNDINPNFRMLLIENTKKESFRSLSDYIKRTSVNIKVEKDPIIEAKIQKKIEEEKNKKEKEKQKAKVVK